MEATEGFLEKIKPPRIEDAGIEDCALPPDAIAEAFRRAASAVRSFISDGDGCVDDPFEHSTDAVVGIKDGVDDAPSGGCAVEKGTEAGCDEVVVAGGDAAEKKDEVVTPPVKEGEVAACVDGLQGLEIGGKGKGISGKQENEKEEEGDDDREKPILAEGYV